ncbi:MAG TPA: hypothetical protein VM390_06650 [Acidimicrobiales bacterium]|nr:hypothetical protein [Acidimicrobiales bacterium]
MEEQVAEWARQELGLDPGTDVAVREKESNDPRCSPVVTELRIEAPGEPPFAFHIERPLAEVTQMDVLAAIAFGGH